MSHISPMNTVTGTMNLPLVVAALTSVGLHSLIWYYQPVVPMADKLTAKDRRSVKVVQLTPEEILRLPEYAQQRIQTTLPNLPPGQVQAPINLLPNLPPEAKSEITLPPPPSFPIYNPNPSTPVPSPEVKTPTSRRRNRTTVPKSPQDAAKNNRRNNQSSRNQKPETTGKSTIDRSNSESQLPPPEKTRSRSPSTNQTQSNSQRSSSEFWETYKQYLAQQNLDTTSQSIRPRQGETPSQDNQNQNNEQTTGTLTDQIQLQRNLVAGAARQPQNRNEENIANRSNLRNNVNPGDEEARIKAVYGYNDAGTTIPQGLAKYEEWLKEKITNYSGRLNTKREPIRDTIRSSFEIKLPDVTPAAIAVLVNPEGKVLETELTRSTGYKQFNDLAIAQVEKRSFPKTGKYEIYLYQINVDQKDLPDASDAANR